MTKEDAHVCLNSDVKITKLTADEIEAVCEKCGKVGHADRKDYLPFEWRQLQIDAQTKHEMVGV